MVSWVCISLVRPHLRPEHKQGGGEESSDRWRGAQPFPIDDKMGTARWQRCPSKEETTLPPDKHLSCCSCRIHVREEEVGRRKRALGSEEMSNERRCMAALLHPPA